MRRDTNKVKENWYLFMGGNFVKIVLSPSEKGSTLKGKNLLHTEANSYF